MLRLTPPMVTFCPSPEDVDIMARLPLALLEASMCRDNRLDRVARLLSNLDRLASPAKRCM